MIDYPAITPQEPAKRLRRDSRNPYREKHNPAGYLRSLTIAQVSRGCTQSPPPTGVLSAGWKCGKGAR
jgi:hypothetical protein